MSTPLPQAPGPIGVFDSGYGGLTILHGIRQLLPQYDYLYLGDNARAPYGSRSFDGFQNCELASGSVAAPMSPMEAPRASGAMDSEVTPVVMGLNSVSLISPSAKAAEAVVRKAAAAMYLVMLFISVLKCEVLEGEG